MSTVHSSRWHRVAALKPWLVESPQLRRQHLRGESWIVISGPGGGRSVRLNAAAWALVGRLDGTRSVQQLWDWHLSEPGESFTQDELIDTLAQLREAAVLRVDRPADFDRLLPHLQQLERGRHKGSLLAWRVPLANPGPLLDRLAPLARALFSRTGFAVWAAAVALLLALALQHAPTLWDHGARWMATPRYALLAALLYVPIKAVHELSHGLALRRWGGRVRRAGITLMLLMPVPWVDASAASGFERRRQRVIVGAAGMMAELALASIALPLWLWLDDGLGRDIAYVTLAIAGVSTLLFNANPLQRLDGYFILVDALDLPNLATRSRQWWQHLLLRRVLRSPGAERLDTARGEAPWLAAYAPLSWLYGLGVAAIAVFWLGHVSLPLGLACGAVLAWQVLLTPPWRWLRQLRQAALAQDGSAARWRVLMLGGAVFVLALLVLPMPQHTLVQGVVWPSEQAQLRSDEDGFVESVLVSDGEAVAADQVVLQLASPGLQTKLSRQSAQVAALETALFSAMPTDAAPATDARVDARADAPRAGDARIELAKAMTELERLQERERALAVRARVAGRLALPQAADLPGRFIKHGALLGRVLTDEAPAVRVALPESEATDLRRSPGAISVRLAANRGTAFAATLRRDGVGAVRELPSAALSTRHGGDVPTDPEDRDALRPVQTVVVMDVQLAAGAVAPRIGERASVRFDTGFAPPALQLLRGARRTVMQRFNPQF